MQDVISGDDNEDDEEKVHRLNKYVSKPYDAQGSDDDDDAFSSMFSCSSSSSCS